MDDLVNGKISENYGCKIDERVIEYPWLFSLIPDSPLKILDAGSTFNFEYLLINDRLSNKDLYIYTLAPESKSFTSKGVSYIYGDLRDLPFKDNLFDMIISQSTIEHIGMNNSIYKQKSKTPKVGKEKSYEYLGAILEMVRTVKKNGTILLTFPFGKYENHDFFQQLDLEMLERIYDLIEPFGSFKTEFFKYKKEGWSFAKKEELKDFVSYNPHTGKGFKNDGAAHCRSIACISFKKS